ncbi:haloacid dehalogenase type II [Halobium salinum]|uniref:Haloacid dehalogenase type II n=1 Tax=Halobium salinum TaxID=1364940 RepID=A0ABD5PDF4_9EURY|nr:haloacid dehalogenase type II [Halobium salinum]
MARTFCFDMYGTLCDTSSVTATLGEELGVSAALVDEIDATWRRRQLEYANQVSLMEAYRPFWEVTSAALDYALARYALSPDEETRERILDAYNHLDPHEGAAETLERLGAADHAVTVLSNGNPEMLERLAENAGLAPHLDDLVSADEVSTFKPSPAVYENAAERTGRDIGDCTLVSGNAWDVAGAGAAGMETAWVNRARDPPEEIGADPTDEFRTLTDVAVAFE